MNKGAGEKLARILGVTPDTLDDLDREMAARLGRTGVVENLVEENERHIERMLAGLGAARDEVRAEEVRNVLREAAGQHETQLLAYLKTAPGKDDFERAAALAKRIARIGRGFFLKKSFGAEILEKNRPDNLLKFLGYADIGTMLKHHDVTEIWSALRFIESDKWMHETFEKGYGNFTAADFEERDVEIKVLGPEWHEIAKKFVAKKHHNVSHLKEFGVIFLNAISEDIQGKFVRDFALLLHYFHEIDFYSKLFRRYAAGPGFPERLKALLRGDVKDVRTVAPGEWLIVQRYLAKIDPQDPRLFLPRVNPESIHWMRGERDLASLGQERPDLDLELWLDLDWVGSVFDHGNERIVSFDLEDNAMSEVSFREGKNEFFNYHQREALWTKLFFRYAGGEMAAERLLIENYDKGSVVFKKR
ncbi:MAG: hypothetical protein AAB759_00845 [Patescibacteria group bacterium]